MAKKILFPILNMNGYGVARTVEEETLYSRWFAALVNSEEEIIATVLWSRLWKFIEDQEGNWDNLSQFFKEKSLEEAKITFLFAEICA